MRSRTFLQGVSRHSDQGIMKAHWDQKEYRYMACKPLEFETEDIDLIHLGLAARAGTIMAKNVAAVRAQ